MLIEPIQCWLVASKLCKKLFQSVQKRAIEFFFFFFLSLSTLFNEIGSSGKINEDVLIRQICRQKPKVGGGVGGVGFGGVGGGSGETRDSHFLKREVLKPQSG